MCCHDSKRNWVAKVTHQKIIQLDVIREDIGRYFIYYVTAIFPLSGTLRTLKSKIYFGNF